MYIDNRFIHIEITKKEEAEYHRKYYYLDNLLLESDTTLSKITLDEAMLQILNELLKYKLSDVTNIVKATPKIILFKVEFIFTDTTSHIYAIVNDDIDKFLSFVKDNTGDEYIPDGCDMYEDNDIKFLCLTELDVDQLYEKIMEQNDINLDNIDAAQAIWDNNIIEL